MTYHENIRIYRNAAGMTQTELALKLGYTDRSSIAKIETNKMNVPVEQLEKIADVLGVAPVDLLCWNDSGAAEITAIYSQLNAEGQAALHGTAVAFGTMPQYSKKSNTNKQEA